MSDADQSGSSDSTQIDIRELSTINQLADVAADGISEGVGMLGSDTEMHVRRVSFLDLLNGNGTSDISGEQAVGIRARLTDAPKGHLLVEFTQENAQKVTQLMLSDMDGVDTETAKDAARELGNVMVSQFIDAWAKVFDAEMNHSPPDLVYSGEDELIKSTASIDNNPFALVFETVLEADNQKVTAKFYLFPNLPQFVKMVKKVSNN